jgi:regulator of nucleoside diphosphate kinase
MATPAKLPPITITASDYERLARIASAFVDSSPDEELTLADELDRARIVDSAGVAPGVVTMNSRVEFYFDGRESDRRTVTLVYPGEQDIAKGRISVHTPVGIALLGLSEGQSIEWTAPSGASKRLTVTKVVHRPEAGLETGGADAQPMQSQAG